MMSAGAEVSVGRKGAMLGSLGDGDGGRMFVAGVGTLLAPVAGEGDKLKRYGAGMELELADECNCMEPEAFWFAVEPGMRL